MKTYQYKVLRYLHDLVTGEFANIGILFYLPEDRQLKCRFVTKSSRISEFFDGIDTRRLFESIRHLEKLITSIGRTTEGLQLDSTSLDEIADSVLPRDDSALRFSETRQGIDPSPETALDDVFNRIVNQYVRESTPVSRSDEDVWRKIYKRHFEKYGITQKLSSHVVETANDRIVFSHAWKNGVWNCYQALAFDLSRGENVKNKAYRWAGILAELESSKQGLHVNFLISSPRQKELEAFVLNALGKKKHKNVRVSVVHEKDAKKFALDLRDEIEKEFGSLMDADH
jgi:hypothetical protein